MTRISDQVHQLWGSPKSPVAQTQMLNVAQVEAMEQYVRFVPWEGVDDELEARKVRSVGIHSALLERG